MGLPDSLTYRARLRWYRRTEYENLALRRWFADRFGVEVGLYSYGCFDRHRIPPHTRIGRYCAFAQTAHVVDRNHPVQALSTHPFLYEPQLGVIGTGLPDPPTLEMSDDVWVGHNAIILPGCKAIGRGAVIGAGAVVTHDVAPYAIVGGNPARVLRMRFDPPMIAALERSRWWEMSRQQLSRLAQTSPDLLLRPTVERLALLQSAGKPA